MFSECNSPVLESPLECKEIQLVHPKRDQSWVFIGRTDVEAETPILWPPDAKSWLIGKNPDAGKDWGQEEKGTTEDEMVGWHHQLNGCGFGWTLGVGDGQGGLVCCGSWGRKESDTTERLNWTELNSPVMYSSSICPSLCIYGGLVAEAMGLVHVGWEERVRLSPQSAWVYSSWSDWSLIFPAYSSSLPFHFCCAHTWDPNLRGCFPFFSLSSFSCCWSLGCQRPSPLFIYSWPISSGSYSRREGLASHFP